MFNGDMDQRVARLEKKAGELTAQLESYKKQARRQEELLKFINEHKSIRLLDEVQERIKYLGGRLQIAIIKESVATELTRIHPDMWTKIVRSFDQPDEWWAEGGDLPLKQWAVRVSALSDIPLMGLSDKRAQTNRAAIYAQKQAEREDA